MGICYSISCLDCKVTCDLDKIGDIPEITSKLDVVRLSEQIKIDSHQRYRIALLFGFLGKHCGHRVAFCSDCGDSEDQYETWDFKEVLDFWGINQ